MHWIAYILLATLLIYIAVIIIYYFIQERILFVANPLPKNFKYNISESYDEYFIESADRGRINALHIKGDDASGLIISAQEMRWIPTTLST